LISPCLLHQSQLLCLLLFRYNFTSWLWLREFGKFKEHLRGSEYPSAKLRLFVAKSSTTNVAASLTGTSGLDILLQPFEQAEVVILVEENGIPRL